MEKRLTDLSLATSVGANDLFWVVRSGNSVSQRITRTTLMNGNIAVGNSTVNTTITGNTVTTPTLVLTRIETPANSSITITQGSMFFDVNYLYIAVANNVLKQVPLSSF